MNGTQKIKQLKREYVAYFKDVPIQKYAAMAIARDEDTIIRWKKEDQEFADAIQIAKADWIRKKLIATKAEFALERLEKDVFKEGIAIETETPQRAGAILPDNEYMMALTKAHEKASTEYYRAHPDRIPSPRVSN